MFTRSGVISAVWFALLPAAGVAFAEGPNLGKPIDAADIAAWDISIQPDGTGCRRAPERRPTVPASTRRNASSATVRTAKVGSRACLLRRWSAAAR
jgi:hypothetical protein